VSYRREGDTVVLTMPVEDFEGLLLMLGYAAGAAVLTRRGDFWNFMDLANRINDGNPHFTPYEIPAEFRRTKP
jgi:hypothetical protein